MFISRLLCDYIWIMLHQLGLQTVCVCCCNQLRIYYITSIDVTLHALKHKASYSYIYAITYILKRGLYGMVRLHSSYYT